MTRSPLENQLHAILETVGEGVISIDTSQRIRVINREVERIFGYTRDELIGAPIHNLMPERYHAAHNAAFARRVKNPGGADPVKYRELEGRRKDGTIFPLEVRFTNVEVGGELFFIASARDITERKQAREELEMRSREIARLNEELRRERDYLLQEVKSSGQFGEVICKSHKFKLVLAQVDAVAKTDATVLILGESGVGKELIARTIHERSRRKDRPLVRVNCASIAKNLFESEFFGHTRGAFTGAVRDREGRFQLADSGTIFLDEIGEVPVELQSKLLRVLQEQQFERVGDDRTRSVDVRVIAATNRDLLEEVARGRFREDLYYRLGVFPIEVLPLRERREDILPLAVHFLRRSSERMGLPVPRVTRSAAKMLAEYNWPGNVRELQNVIERGVILAAGQVIRPDMLALDLSARIQQRLARGLGANDMPPRRLQPVIEPTREQIVDALHRHAGIVKRAAADLGLSRPALYRRMKRLGIQPPRAAKS